MGKGIYRTPVGSVKDGSIICFPTSIFMFMKVCDKNGHGGVVRLYGGKYIGSESLEAENLGLYCNVVYDDIDKMYYDGEED